MRIIASILCLGSRILEWILSRFMLPEEVLGIKRGGRQLLAFECFIIDMAFEAYSDEEAERRRDVGDGKGTEYIP